MAAKATATAKQKAAASAPLAIKGVDMCKLRSAVDAVLAVKRPAVSMGPAWENVCMKMERPGWITLSACNGIDTEVVASVPATVPAPLFGMRLVAPRAWVRAAFHGLWGEHSIEIDGEGSMRVVSDNSLRTLSAHQWDKTKGYVTPSLPSIAAEPVARFACDAGSMKRLFKSVSYAAARLGPDLLRGVRLEASESWLDAVATDSFRMAHARIHVVSEPTEGTVSATMAHRTLSTLLSISAGRIAEFEVTPDGVRCSWGGVQVNGVAAGASYPNWRKIIPQNTPIWVSCDARVILCAIRQIEPAAKEDGACRVVFQPHSSGIQLSSGRNASVVASVVIPGLCTHETAVNCKYLRQWLQQSGANGPVTLRNSGPLDVVLCESASCDGEHHVIMPVQPPHDV